MRLVLLLYVQIFCIQSDDDAILTEFNFVLQFEAYLALSSNINWLMDTCSWKMVISYVTRKLAQRKRRRNLIIQMCHHFWNMFVTDRYSVSDVKSSLLSNSKFLVKCMLR